MSNKRRFAIYMLDIARMNGKQQAERSFVEDFSSCWQQLPNKTFFLVLLALWLALFHFLGNSTFGYFDTPSVFRWMNFIYFAKNSDDAHGTLIPFVVFGLLWWKRKELLALPLRTWSPGLLIVALAIVLHIGGYVIQQTRISVVAMFIGVYGLIGLAWGPKMMRATFFPFFLFAFCVPMATVIEPVTFRLRLLVSQAVVLICNHVLAIDVIRDGTQLFDGMRTYQYEVAAACSGIRSLIATVAMAIVYAFVFFQSPAKRVFLMACAVPLALIGNVVRLLTIIVAATLGGQEWGAYVHEGGPFGILSLLPYIPAILGLILLGKWLERKQPRRDDNLSPMAPQAAS